jgi:ribonuclease P protein component
MNTTKKECASWWILFSHWSAEKFASRGLSNGDHMIPKTAAMSEYGYPKKERLLKRSDYLLLSRTGETCHKKHFLCIYKKGCANCSRMGITVSKKVGPAVTRNRIKRLCREFFRQNKSKLGGAWDINIIAKRSVANASREQALESLNGIFLVIAENQS